MKNNEKTNSYFNKLLDNISLERVRNRYFFIIDFILFMFIPFLIVTIRYEGFSYDIMSYLNYAVFLSITKVTILYLFGIYSRWWNHASIDDLLQILYAGLTIFISQMFFLLLSRFLSIPIFDKIPLSVAFGDTIFSILVISFLRLNFRIRSSVKNNNGSRKRNDNTLIYGAGAAGVMVLEEVRKNSNTNMHIAGFIDDDLKKVGLYIRGVRVLGDRNNLPDIIKKHDIKKIIIAMPSTPGYKVKEIVDLCNQLKNIKVFTLPPIYDIINGKVEVNKIKNVEIDDLLKREPIKTDIDKIEELIKDKSVLVTGGGGSIGLEICKQVLRYHPSELLLLGHGENSIFEAYMELKKLFPSIKIVPIIADIRDMLRLRQIFSDNKIDFVFHAAAHKHVPLMEAHPYEAIMNNIVGTKNLIDCSVEFDVKKFISISTDKAVNPTSVMGTTKRIAEMVVINAAKKYNRKFSVVRFGNVLGSRGSVVKIFKRQIEQGGPLTITHPEIERYFMTIPESVQLVMQAFSMGNGGDIFVFDMGKPVKIRDLAHDLIKLSGLKVNEDIKIVYTNLRPGEKMYEELFNTGENYNSTKNDKIYIAENSFNIVPDNFEEKLNYLINFCRLPDASDKDLIIELKNLVPNFIPREGSEVKNKIFVI